MIRVELRVELDGRELTFSAEDSREAAANASLDAAASRVLDRIVDAARAALAPSGVLVFDATLTPPEATAIRDRFYERGGS